MGEPQIPLLRTRGHVFALERMKWKRRWIWRATSSWLQIPKDKSLSTFLSVYFPLCGTHSPASKGEPGLQWLKQREVCPLSVNSGDRWYWCSPPAKVGLASLIPFGLSLIACNFMVKDDYHTSRNRGCVQGRKVWGRRKGQASCRLLS